jgi:hypothetical protein
MTNSLAASELGYAYFWKNLEKFLDSKISIIEKFLHSENRSSTIFPIYLNQSTATLLFLSYWLKKHDSRVVIKFTARDVLGNIVGTDFMIVLKYCSITYSADSFDYFKSPSEGFCGSIEVEVFSESAPKYSFPAISLVYQNPKGCAVVHSCVRTYNQSEYVADYALNFPQTGFDILLSDECRNYICFFGGRKSCYDLTLILECENKKIEVPIKLKNFSVGQLHTLYAEDFIDDGQHGKSLKISIVHDLDVFPRFYAGVVKVGFVPTLTHTFFDTSEKNFVIDHPTLHLRSNNEKPDDNYDCALMIPIYRNNQFKTRIVTYGQNLTHYSRLNVTAYSDLGQILFQKQLDPQEANRLNKVSSIDIEEFLESNKISNNERYSLHFGFVHNCEKPFPKRFKLALNVSRQGAELGSNICFAPLVLTESTLAKPFTRRWFPLGGEEQFVASIHNTSILRSVSDSSTKISCEFVNINGDVLIRETCLTSNSSLYLDTDSDEELRSFFCGKTGWCLVNSNSYHCDSYYFSTAGSLIGGDHAY